MFLVLLSFVDLLDSYSTDTLPKANVFKLYYSFGFICCLILYLWMSSGSYCSRIVSVGFILERFLLEFIKSFMVYSLFSLFSILFVAFLYSVGLDVVASDFIFSIFFLVGFVFFYLRFVNTLVQAKEKRSFKVLIDKQEVAISNSQNEEEKIKG